MEHNYVRDDNFNILTIKYTNKGIYFVTGETSEPLAVGDTINYITNAKYDILGVTKITERRDSRSFPKGNGLHYECECKQVANPNPPKAKTE